MGGGELGEEVSQRPRSDDEAQGKQRDRVHVLHDEFSSNEIGQEPLEGSLLALSFRAKFIDDSVGSFFRAF